MDSTTFSSQKIRRNIKIKDMKLFCNDEESEQVCKIMNEFDVHNSTYIKVNHIEFSKQITSKRDTPEDPMIQIESNCVKVNGTDRYGYRGSSTSHGTRYVYESEKLYTEIRKWYDNRLQKRREEKLKEILE
jgi:hypothetical protein